MYKSFNNVSNVKAQAHSADKSTDFQKCRHLLNGPAFPNHFKETLRSMEDIQLVSIYPSL